MKYLDGNYYVEVKDHRYPIHPTEKFFFTEKRSSKVFENSISSSK